MPEPMASSPQARDEADGLRRPQLAELDVTAGPITLHVRVRVTPAGLLAIGALVSGILLGSAVIVWSAASVAKRRPLIARILPGNA